MPDSKITESLLSRAFHRNMLGISKSVYSNGNLGISSTNQFITPVYKGLVENHIGEGGQ